MEKEVLPDIIQHVQQTAHRLQIILDSRMENVK
jgi:predicted small metal-binding protein